MTLEKELKKQMHGRNRSEWRHSISSQSALRERARKQGKMAAVIKSIFGTHVDRYDMNLLRLADGSTLVEPAEIHENFATHFKQWHQGNGRKTFFDDHVIDWANPHELRDAFMDYEGHSSIPPNILLRIWEAVIGPVSNFPELPTLLRTATSEPVSIEELRAAIKRAPASSVPGPSGLSYAMMKEWPEEVLQAAHNAMTQIWDNGIIPEWWQWKWICPIPKVDPDIATLDDLRPIALLETTRKLWMGIIVGRITTVWERELVLSNGQYGFRRQRSTESPIVQVINALEEAEESATEIHGSSWDIRRAFDSVPKSILVMSWERLGVPKDIANYIVDLDRECLTVPLTPHAKHLLHTRGRQAFSLNPTSATNARGFFGVTGTPQGDTPSPTNWNAAFDILLRALEAANLHPFFIRSGCQLHPVQDTAYADDLFSISARKEGLQLKADIVSAFAGVFGIKIATTKLRTFAKCWGSEPSGWSHGDYTLTVRDERWEPTEISVQYANLHRIDSVFRYLGVHIDSNNLYCHQHRLLLQQIREVARAARYKRASPETIDMALTTSLHKKISYPAKYMPWPVSKLRQLDSPLNGLLKKHLHMLPSTANAALYMTTDVGGMGLRRLSDQIILDKFTMLHRGLHSDLHSYVATAGLMDRSLRIGQTDTDLGYEAVISPQNVPHLLLPLLEAGNEANLFLRRGGLPTINTASCTLTSILPPMNNGEDFVHLRLTTFADLMSYTANGNSWNMALCRRFSGLTDSLPTLIPEGDRRLKVGQYWSSEALRGHEGYLVEIMGFREGLVVGRTWINLTSPGQWEKDNPSSTIWFTPLISGSSLGAGASETFPLSSFLQADMWNHLLSKEVTVRNRHSPTYIKRALEYSSKERTPVHITCLPTPLLQRCAMLDLWESWISSIPQQHLSVYTDGSMRYVESLQEKLFTQPKSIRKATYAQGGLLFHHEDDLTGSCLSRSFTATLCNGTELQLSLPSSVEIYSLILAVYLLAHSHKSGIIYTDYLEAVKVSRRPHTFRNMGRNANLPLYELLLNMLARSPGITLEFVKAHGPLKEQLQWTTQQWGNYHADRIAKNNVCSFSTHHVTWPFSYLETLVKLYPSWHWVDKDGHLALEPLRRILSRQTHFTYMTRRDEFRSKRGQGIKWQYAHMGLVDDTWHISRLSLSKRASIHRLLYDKGFHGGNRAKIKLPVEVEEENWVGCGMCGAAPDSQHHWIRSCPHDLISPLRRQALAEATTVIQDLVMSKGQAEAKRECFNICSNVIDYAESAIGGEQLWLGIFPTNMIMELTSRMNSGPLDSSSKLAVANLWRRTLLKILTILAKAAKAMWSIKENHRRNELPVQQSTGLGSCKKRHRLPDIRPYLRAQRRRIGSLHSPSLNLEEGSIDDLLNSDTSTVACTGTRLQRLSSVQRALPVAPHPPSLNHHHFFSLCRRHQNRKKMRQRTLNSAAWDSAFDMPWLRTATVEVSEETLQGMESELGSGLDLEPRLRSGTEMKSATVETDLGKATGKDNSHRHISSTYPYMLESVNSNFDCDSNSGTGPPPVGGSLR
jgi:hypothetical protein